MRICIREDVTQHNSGKVHVYTGDGKGKTTAAFGLASRAVSKSLTVLVIQFIKGKGEFGEVTSARKLGVEVEQYGTGRMLKQGDITDADRKEAKSAFERAKKAVESSEANLIILDEINVAVFFNLLDLNDVLEMIKTKPKDVELVLTGRKASPEIIDLADYVTEMKQRKHPYNRGEKARPGIEY
jgi:cob(I)alamin adenosyltransferase